MTEIVIVALDVLALLIGFAVIAAVKPSRKIVPQPHPPLIEDEHVGFNRPWNLQKICDNDGNPL